MQSNKNMNKNIVPDYKAISFKYSEEHTPHTMYIKEYSPQCYDEEKPLGRTLLVVRVSLYLDENDVKKLFSDTGPIVSVILQRNKSDDESENSEIFINGFQSAYIIYKTRESLMEALNLDTLKTLTDEKYKPISGLQKYIKEYNNSICDHSVLLEEATKSIQLYDKQEEEKKIREKNNVDDDGWTVVMSKSRNPNSDPKSKEKLNNKKKKKKQHLNFYTFQIKESKMKNLAALREGYEEAKRKVANMKKNRSFKPY